MSGQSVMSYSYLLSLMQPSVSMSTRTIFTNLYSRLPANLAVIYTGYCPGIFDSPSTVISFVCPAGIVNSFCDKPNSESSFTSTFPPQLSVASIEKLPSSPSSIFTRSLSTRRHPSTLTTFIETSREVLRTCLPPVVGRSALIVMVASAVPTTPPSGVKVSVLSREPSFLITPRSIFG